MHSYRSFGVMISNCSIRSSLALLDSAKMGSFFSRRSPMLFKKSYCLGDIALMMSSLRIIIKSKQVSLNDLNFDSCFIIRFVNPPPYSSRKHDKFQFLDLPFDAPSRLHLFRSRMVTRFLVWKCLLLLARACDGQNH